MSSSFRVPFKYMVQSAMGEPALSIHFLTFTFTFTLNFKSVVVTQKPDAFVAYLRL